MSTSPSPQQSNASPAASAPATPVPVATPASAAAAPAPGAPLALPLPSQLFVPLPADLADDAVLPPGSRVTPGQPLLVSTAGARTFRWRRWPASSGA